MAAFTAYDAVGKMEDVSSIITSIAPTKTPFTTLVGSESIHNIVHQWQEDDLAAAAANAQVEGAAAPTETATATVLRSNTTQIMAKTAKVTNTMDAVKAHGRAKELAYQKSLRSAELKRDLEFACVGSAAVKVAGDNSTARIMAGYQQQITLTGTGAPVVLNGVTATAAGIAALTGSAAAAITETMITTLAQTLYSNGTDPDVLMVRPSDSVRVAAFATVSGRTRDLRNTKEIVNCVTTYVTPFGDLRVVMNRFQRAGDALMFEPDMWRRLALRPWFTTNLAVTGDSHSVSITGEYSLKHRNFKASGLITGLALT